MLLSAPKVTAVHPRMVPWFLGAVSADQSASKDPSQLNGMDRRGKKNVNCTPLAVADGVWRPLLFNIFHTPLNSVEKCLFE